MPRTGRRPGPTDTRSDVLAAARRLFAEKGYDGTTIRAIARAAGVDPALVHHFYGTKEGVFVAAMELPFDPGTALGRILEGGVDGIGERFARFFLSIWRNPESRAPFLGLIRAAMTQEQAATMLREFVSTALVGRAAAELGVPRLGAELAASHLVGMALLRYVIRVEPLASADEETVIALVAPTIQRYFTTNGASRGDTEQNRPRGTREVG